MDKRGSKHAVAGSDFYKRNQLLKSKHAMEMAIGTVVVIILAIVLLTASIFILTRSKGEFASTIKSYFTKSNVDLVVNNCNNLVNSGSSYEYCCVDQTIKLSSKEEYKMSCDMASNESWGSRINEMECEGIC